MHFSEATIIAFISFAAVVSAYAQPHPDVYDSELYARDVYARDANPFAYPDAHYEDALYIREAEAEAGFEDALYTRHAEADAFYEYLEARDAQEAYQDPDLQDSWAVDTESPAKTKPAPGKVAAAARPNVAVKPNAPAPVDKSKSDKTAVSKDPKKKDAKSKSKFSKEQWQMRLKGDEAALAMYKKRVEASLKAKMMKTHALYTKYAAHETTRVAYAKKRLAEVSK